ncbi:PREDICTED: uncharacterized protein LOC108561211 [Nicrophorus vespilloides]|uniref:Uncharacterized protein LOC108561211 n=1 Tax=Nicrophorus vespilloides TaxID=110193 RepID=A0ABM1MIZ5_NICVS|nr:PREDICTED: uncharacterized protein LOC108561211 [Nicrophorus vespilloides]
MGIRNVMICFSKRQKIVNFLNWLTTFDTKLYKAGVSMDFRSIKYLMIIRSFFITLTVTVNPVVCTLSRQDMNICFEHFISYNLTFIINSMIMLQFSVYVFILWQRLRVINNSITNMVTNGSLSFTNDKYPPILYKKQEMDTLLKLLCAMHNEICNNAKLLNEIFSEVILLTIIKTFADILNGLHTLSSKTQLILIIFDCSWGVALLIEVVFILIPCTSTRHAVCIIVK